MATRGSKKRVTVTVDADALQDLSDALRKLSELACTYDAGADDPSAKKKLMRNKPRGRK